MIASQKKL